MLEIRIPGHDDLQIQHLVLDYNGTLACDGEMIPGVRELLGALSDDLAIHVLTADTFGKARDGLRGCAGKLVVLPTENQDEGKRQYVQRLGASSVASVGNGRNDRLMLQEAALGIAVVQREGAAGQTLMAADVVCGDVVSALELLIHPLRLVATLRS